MNAHLSNETILDLAIDL